MNETEMKAFLVRVVERALSWPGVEGVSVAVEPNFAFENHGYDGRVTLFLRGNLKCSAILSSTEARYLDDPMWLLEPLRRMVESAMASEVQTP
jgi:hypothetical protein